MDFHLAITLQGTKGTTGAEGSSGPRGSQVGSADTTPRSPADV